MTILTLQLKDVHPTPQSSKTIYLKYDYRSLRIIVDLYAVFSININ